MKVQFPLFGKATGSSAGTIYQSYWGRTYSRSFPFSFHYPDTKKQQECQSTFFDIQRVWLPIYNVIKSFFNPMQRTNKNPFNKLIGYIFRIFNPYAKHKMPDVPSSFGLDRKNLMSISLAVSSTTINEDEVSILFDLNRPYNSTGYPITKIHFLLLNKTQQSMLYQNEPLSYTLRKISFRNTQGWKEKDEIYFYVAASANNWFGNFNLMQL